MRDVKQANGFRMEGAVRLVEFKMFMQVEWGKTVEGFQSKEKDF